MRFKEFPPRLPKIHRSFDYSSKINYSKYIFIFSALFTPIFVSVFVWLDNKEGFRDAQAITGLFSLLLGFYSFLCVIGTLIWQMRELGLQREELRLQRMSLDLQKDEMSRIAAANEDHHATDNERRLIEFKRQMVISYFNYLSSVADVLSNGLRNQCNQLIRSEATFLERKLLLRSVTGLRFIRNEMFFVSRPDHSREANIEADCTSFLGFFRTKRYLESSEFSERVFFTGLLDPLLAMKKDCETLGLKDWFINDIISSIGRVDGLNADEAYLLHRLACLVRIK